MSDVETGAKKEITEKDLKAAIKTEIIIFLEEHREAIVKRAHARLRAIIRETSAEKKAE